MPVSGSVLVITGSFDPTADLVIEELARRAVPVFRADMAWFPSSLTLAASLEGLGWRGTLATDQRSLDLSNVRSVYYRRPTAPEFPDDMPPEARAVAMAEARRGFGGLLAALPCPWLPPPGRAADAEYKPLQLRVAAEVGLHVPRTLITNDPAAASRFADRLGSPVVYKPFSPIRGTLDGRSVAVYANVLRPDDLPHPDIATTAHLFQEWIPKVHEVRLTVVGDRLFAAEIHAGSAAGHVDWRSDYESLTYRMCDPPAAVGTSVRRLLARLGLNFGAFDFIVSPSGEWWFLEVNPNGQWGFIEQATGLPITAAICDYLEGNRR
ncbi:ATP-grasp ribosomal peptide maturase [Kitasatospora sp. NBC_01287]|uniref:ATP-grasp ribosomal peptide maturase n=1 Tax=Kitasatospora sp. NBC_01287 TaxID=2903573 RepID=UPI0022518E31|nr:ATP-grasp ribosomal peptide maturase [Kitasatospora sp. NBC_01287]MCX4749652.1 ATP-grasp ribosomal peptide maturase [Kitasatospora sp. NBC_01287]